MKNFTYIFILFFLFFSYSCTDKRKSPIETTKMFIKNLENKNVKKIHELITAKDSKKLKKDNKNILRLNSQINKFHIKSIKLVSKEEPIKVEITFESDEKEIINLKKIDDKYYVDLGL